MEVLTLRTPFRSHIIWVWYHSDQSFLTTTNTNLASPHTQAIPRPTHNIHTFSTSRQTMNNIDAEGNVIRREDPIVTSGESDEGVLDSDDEESRLVHFEDDKEETDALYDENADDDDEAYVYNHLRSGAAEPSAQKSGEQGKIVKPRNSDAVLSCPCCLQIVTMDTQRHERYANQYRAMFVMNIVVRWDVRLRYDTNQSQLVPVEAPLSPEPSEQHHTTIQSPRIIEDHPEEKDTKQEEAIYYKVRKSLRYGMVKI